MLTVCVVACSGGDGGDDDDDDDDDDGIGLSYKSPVSTIHGFFRARQVQYNTSSPSSSAYGTMSCLHKREPYSLHFQPRLRSMLHLSHISLLQRSDGGKLNHVGTNASGSSAFIGAAY